MSKEYVDSIMNSNVDQDYVKSITAPSEEPLEFLPQEQANKYTSMMRDMNGEDMPAIETEDDLEGADMFESNKLVQENEDASQIANIQDALDGTYDPIKVQARAYGAAKERVELEETGGFTGAVASSDAIYELAQEMLQSPEISYKDYNEVYTALAQQKFAIYNSFVDKVRREADKQGGWQTFRDVGANVFVGYPEWKRSVRRGYVNPEKGTEYVHPINNTLEFSEMWSSVLLNPDVSPSEYSKELETFLKYLKEIGMSPKECLESLELMYDPDVGTAYFEAGADALSVAGMATSGAKGFVKGAKYATATSKSTLGKAIKAPLYGSIRGGSRAVVDPFFTIDAFYDSNQSLYAKLLKFKNGTKAERAANAGNIVKAAGEAIKEVETQNGSLKGAVKIAQDIEDVKTAKGTKDSKTIIQEIKKAEPTLVNRTGNGYNQTVFDNFLTAIAKPDADLTPAIAASSYIKRYNNLLRKFANLNESLKDVGVGELKRLQDELLNKEANNIFDRLLGRFSKRIDKEYKDNPAGNLLKANAERDIDQFRKTVDNANVRFKDDGSIFAIGRYPTATKDKEVADSLADLINQNSNQVKAQTIKLLDGSYTVEYGMNFKNGFGTLFKKASNTIEDWKAIPAVSALFTKTSNPKDINQIAALLDAEVSALRSMGESVNKIVKGLGGNDTDILNALLERTTETRGWFTPDDVFKITESEKITNAYEKLMTLDHYAFLKINEGIRLDMARQGCKVIRRNAEEAVGNLANTKIEYKYVAGYGTIIDSPKLVDEVHKRQFIVVDSFENAPVRMKTLENEVEDTTKLKEINAKASSGDYVLVDLVYGPNAVLKSDNVYYLVKRTEVLADDLPLIVAHYVPGWRKYYSRGSKYVKQLNIKDFTTETKVEDKVFSSTVPHIIGVKTFAAADIADQLVLEKNVESINNIRKHVVVSKAAGGIDYSKADKLIAEFRKRAPYAPFKNSKEFIEWADDIGLDLKHIENDLEMVNNGDTLSSYKNMKLPGSKYVDFIGPVVMDSLTKSSPYEGIVHSSELINRHRSDRTIFSYDFKPMNTVDIKTTVGYLVDDMVNYGVLHRFDDFYANRFAQTFGKLNEGNKTPKDFLLQDFTNLMSNASTLEMRTLAKKAYTAQKNYLFIKETPSKVDQYVSKCVEDILRSAGAVPDSLGLPAWIGKGARLATGAIMKMEPLKRMRWIATQWLLMAGNYTQLLKNFAGPVTLLELAEPLYTPLALKHLFPVYMKFFGTGGDIFKLTERATKAVGADAKASDILFKNMLKLGVLDRGTLGGFIEGSTTSSLLQKTNSFFFNTADTWNQIMAATVALLKNGGDKKVITSAKDIARISDLKNTLYINMGKTGMARAQASSVGKTATQFLGYMMRTLETVAFDKNLTTAQRISMAVGYTAMFGLFSVTGVRFASNIWSRFWGTPEDPEEYENNKEWYDTAGDVLLRGAFNTILNRQGIDVDVSSYFDMSVGDNFMKFSEMSLSELFSNSIPSIKTAKDIFGGLYDTLSWLHYKYLGDGSYAEFSELLTLLAAKRELPASLVRSITLHNLIKTGQLYDSTGRLTLDDNRKLYIVSTALGFNQQTTGLVFEKNFKEQLLKDKASEIKKEYERLYNLQWRYRDDPDGYRAIELLKQKLLRDSGLTIVQQQDIIRSAQGRPENLITTKYDLERFNQYKSRIRYGLQTLPEFNKGE